MKKQVKQLVDEVKRLLQKMSLLTSTHHQYSLARYTLNVSKIMHLIRAVPSVYIEEEMKAFDYSWRNIFAQWMGRQLNDRAYMQALLPVADGAFGIKSATSTGHAGFVASSVGSFQLQKQMAGREDYTHRPETQQALDKINSTSNLSLTLDEILSPQNGKPQSFLSKKITKCMVESFDAGLKGRSLVKLHSIRKGASLVLGSIPNRSLGTYLTNSQWKTLALLLLDLEVMPGGKKCEACGDRLDNLGIHALSCKGKGGGMHTRHEKVGEALTKIFRYAEMACKWETKGLVPGTQQRPADILLPVSEDGRPEAIDVTVRHCCNVSAKTAYLKDPEAVQLAAVKEKEQKYSSLEQDGITFHAFALDVYGQIHSDAAEILERAAHYAAVNKGEDYVVLLRRFRLMIHAALFKQVVQMIQVRG